MNDLAPDSCSSSSSERESSCLTASSTGSFRGVFTDEPPIAVRKGLGMGETLMLMLGSERACCQGDGNLDDSPAWRRSPNMIYGPPRLGVVRLAFDSCGGFVLLVDQCPALLGLTIGTDVSVCLPSYSIVIHQAKVNGAGADHSRSRRDGIPCQGSTLPI